MVMHPIWENLVSQYRKFIYSKKENDEDKDAEKENNLSDLEIRIMMGRMARRFHRSI